MSERAPVAVHCQVDGPASAPVVVLSHSLGMTLAMWEPQLQDLARDFRVVRYDVRGHGRSAVPPGPYDMADLGGDLVALLDRIGAARAHLCGVSLGGMLSLWTAAHHPDRVASLVLCCTSALLGPPAIWQARAAAVRESGMEAVAEGVLDRWFTPGYRARELEVVAAQRAVLTATPAAGYAECCGAIERMDLRAELAAVRAPTLAIAGADDPSTPPDHLFRIAQGIAGAHVVVISGAAHMASIERSEEVTALIGDHLRQPLPEDHQP
jgi:3-oxoadipate enol-lactonase